MKRIEPYLAHIREAIQAIQSYTKGMDFTKDNPQVPWREIKDFRNKLIHDYWELDLELIWNVVAQDIPALEAKLGSQQG